jgi:sigma-E factor negative regulatory protein RseC
MHSQPIHFIPAAQAAPSAAVEGIARVVGVAGDKLWLEPEQTTSCGSCASSARCGSREAGGIGTVASRLEARRFAIDHPGGVLGFHEGERLVVGVSERALLKASLTAYGLPLLTALLAASFVQSRYSEDATTMLGMAGGMAFGFLLARLNARRLAARGEFAPRFLRRARPDETCGTV